jgi:hypothetical protein
MPDWSFGPEGAQAAKVAASGGFGAAVLVYLRHPGTLVRIGLMIGMGVGFATLFAMPVSVFGIKLSSVQTAALWGLLGKVTADGLVRTVERMDFARFLPGSKS